MKQIKFIDEVRITISSGKGGRGGRSFRREKGVPRGGPDGGDGGNGGYVIVSTNVNLNTLLEYTRRNKYKAQDGEDGKNKNKTGKQGEDLILNVPEGTLIRDAQNLTILKDMKKEKDFLFLKGGRGGKGNVFYKSSVHQAPTISQTGESGETRDILLELQLISDIGLLGFPSVGKSSLISKLSNARPKIASYPFTTLTPHLGILDLGEKRSCVLADLPGILPGASEGVGLGYQFLKHLQRTRTFIHILEPKISSQRDPFEDYLSLQKELVDYDKKTALLQHSDPLQKRGQILVLNKSDLLDESETGAIVSQFKSKGLEILPVSIITGYNLSKLKEIIKRRIVSGA